MNRLEGHIEICVCQCRCPVSRCNSANSAAPKGSRFGKSKSVSTKQGSMPFGSAQGSGSSLTASGARFPVSGLRSSASPRKVRALRPAADVCPAYELRAALPGLGRAHGTVGGPRGAQISQFELFELAVAPKLEDISAVKSKPTVVLKYSASVNSTLPPLTSGEPCAPPREKPRQVKV